MEIEQQIPCRKICVVNVLRALFSILWKTTFTYLSQTEQLGLFELIRVLGIDKY